MIPTVLRSMRIATLHFAVVLSALITAANGDIPEQYHGKPFQDATHAAGPQVIPGRLQAAFYDLGGEGIAYHDTDTINHGSGELNYKPGQCEDGVPAAICHFRESDGVDISYVKKLVDLNHPNMVAPDWQQLYIGWTEDGEWTNYTLEVKKAGKYKIAVMYSNLAQTIQFSLNNEPAADCNLPVNIPKQLPLPNFPDWIVWHTWNKAECGEINFPHTGLQLLTLHYKKGNNLAYFDFVPED